MSTIMKCKMCGGDIAVSADMTVGTCQYCGSVMTLPRIDSDKKARLFNRANEYRLNNEFDKAYDAYKTISEEDEQEAEAYWGMILSEYGVEYVEDPDSHKRIPTCHRTKIQSVTASTNYALAIKYADAESKFIYQDEAEELDKLQKNIISVSAKEEPFDVFICYKESDNRTGERTKDSVLAEDIYNALTEKGIRTFFSKVTLESHIGENFEPYIFAALKSARVMILVSTSNENCTSVWVKNEWMRFLQFMQEDKNKAIIPAYADMTAYELPDELVSMQGQDLSKIGSIQDLVRGTTKILGKTERRADDEVLNALLDDKVKREKHELIKKRIAISAFIGIGIIVAGLFYARFPRYYNGYIRMDLKQIWQIGKNVFIIFNGTMGLAIVLYFAAMVAGVVKGFENKLSARLFLGGFLVADIALLYFKISHFSSTGVIPLAFVLAITVVLLAVFVYKTTVKSAALVVLLTAACIFSLALPVPKEKIANSDTFTSSNQIYVNQYFLNIREKATMDSAIIGHAYKGMVFDVVSMENNNEWYKVKTASGKVGYIRHDLVQKVIKIKIVEGYANLREGPGTNNKKIGTVEKGNEYYATKIDNTWYFIKDGTVKGYVGANVSVIAGNN